ncbi:WGxxGxxG family protein [Fredinandcohnia onubensis]|uniref:WGxxGxxG family protein n=1 Tax=Fredinandcohnia onubensis TaxID=1571209 RepID=UPI000C0BF126|nr:WGxxGxxG family protein [Fredinandcohnia onubensis]
MSKKFLFSFCTFLFTAMLLGMSTVQATDFSDNAGSEVTHFAQNGNDTANADDDDDDMDWGWIGLLGLAGLLGLRRKYNDQGNNR